MVAFSEHDIEEMRGTGSQSAIFNRKNGFCICADSKISKFTDTCISRLRRSENTPKLHKNYLFLEKIEKTEICQISEISLLQISVTLLLKFSERKYP